ncbi:MAG: TatD family hydrolase [Acidobacteria bacterium]|nr:TatD family hydrolase [Acidobacteriota bacterium]MBI3658039.1 TatD family hydrolase [Acidobacteriota bacterium]
MRSIDPHIHMYSRVTDDYERMALAGIAAIIEPSFWLGQPRTSVATLVDYWEALLGYEAQRARQFGVEHFCTLSLNPKEANDPRMMGALDFLDEYLTRPGVVGVGEIGFDTLSPAEEEAFRRQLLIGDRRKAPIIIHTAHLNKYESVRRILEIIRAERVAEERIVVDHNTEETIELCLATGVMAGITVYPLTKMSPFRAVNLMRRYGTDRILINSSADWGISDPLSVPHTAQEMRQAGFRWEDIDKVLYQNPFNFFKQSSNFTFAGVE